MPAPSSGSIHPAAPTRPPRLDGPLAAPKAPPSSSLLDADLVCVALPTWDSDYMKSTVHLVRALAARHLAPGRQALYVDYTFTLKDIVQTLRGRQRAPLRRMLGGADRLRRVDVGDRKAVHVLTPPPTLPSGALPSGAVHNWVLALNGRLVGAAIRRAMQRLGMARPIVLNALHPFLGVPLAGRLGERLRTYYCYDEISAATWAHRHGPRLEAEFLTRADLMIVSSAALQERKRAQHPRVHLVRNGVDYALFHQAAGPTERLDGRPCIGYLGSLDDRLDYDLLHAVIAAAPDWRFLFVGRTVDARAEALGRHPNVTLAGAQQPNALPGYLRQMDVGTIPFARTPFTAHVYPLKINEYLAAGRPVVMTPFADLRDFDGLAAVAATPAAFRAALGAALVPAPPAIVEARYAAARVSAWPHRAAAFAACLTAALEARSPMAA